MRKTLVGPRLRQLRSDNGQTQAEMATALGCSTAYVNLLENNQLAKELGVNARNNIRDKFSIDKMVDETAQLYESVLKKC